MKIIHIWSDGSSINNGEKYVGCGGCGYVMLFDDFSGEEDIKTNYAKPTTVIKEGYKTSHVKTTNQREEIISVIEALKSMKTNKYEINVYSDSAYLVNCMNQKWYANWRTNGWKNSKKQPVENREIWEELLDIIEDGFYKINWIKVKGHSGIYFNEMADKLANKGLDESKKILGE